MNSLIEKLLARALEALEGAVDDLDSWCDNSHPDATNGEDKARRQSYGETIEALRLVLGKTAGPPLRKYEVTVDRSVLDIGTRIVFATSEQHAREMVAERSMDGDEGFSWNGGKVRSWEITAVTELPDEKTEGAAQ